MAEMRSEPLEPEPDSTGVGMVTLIALLFCLIFLSAMADQKIIMKQIITEQLSNFSMPDPITYS
jgi:hypothetical protein